MIFIKDQIRDLVKETVLSKHPAWPGALHVEYPADPNHGDYSTNVAFAIGKSFGVSPGDAALEVVKNIALPKWISKVEVAGAGFINFFLAPEFFTEFLETISREADRFGRSEIGKGKTVVTDISHPNVAKPMGAHHLLSTIIGDSLNRIFAVVGYRVIRDNYLGDWGTQFGKLIYAYKTWGDGRIVRKNPIPELLKLYVRFHDEAEKNPDLEDKARKEFGMLEAGDAENKKLWKWIVDLSLEEFHKIWGRLSVNFDYIHGESFYEDKMQAIIDFGIKKKVFVEGELGALIAPLADPDMPPCIIRKSDGATLYATRDLARTKYWEDTWQPDLMVMVVDTAQTLHFKQFFEVAEMLKLTDAKNIHVSFGRMKFPEKRMSTRKGNIVLLEGLLDEAEERAYAIVKEKNKDLSKEKKKEVARQVGIGAVKYAVLSQNRLTDVLFTWEKMLSLEGNSGPYLQYAYARGKSILRKSQKHTISQVEWSVLKEPQELAVARLLPKFPEIIAKAAEEFKPNLITNYLFELAARFNAFYAALPVLHAEKEVRQVRLGLVNALTIVLKNGLNLLGIETPEEM